jgi:hypothetical protein
MAGFWDCGCGTPLGDTRVDIVVLHPNPNWELVKIKRENNHSNCPITLVTIIEAVVPEQPAASCLGDADAVSSSWLLVEKI